MLGFSFDMRAPFILALVGLVCLQLPAQSVQKAKPRAHELKGFLLRQDRKAFETSLGKPFHEEKRPNGNTASGYHLHGLKQDYLVAFYSENKSSEVYGKAVELELTGPEPSGPTGFFGLQLGDPAEKVERVLGKPTKISHEDDSNVDLWGYEQDNYSLEFTPDRKLYSIQILDQPGSGPAGFAGSAEARLFALAIQARDIEKIMEMSSGEIECSWPEDFFDAQSGPARDALADPTSKISVCLQRASRAVLAMGPEMKGADDSIRWWEKHSPGAVTKFPSSSPLKEIVFDQEAGAWRVYEVTFR
jgi:hypothetical protein